MIAVLQRIKNASVTINQNLKSEIGNGLLILLGVAENDSEKEIHILVNKILKMRIFADEAGKMNLSVMDIDGEILVVSQFTLCANTKKGNRPSFTSAAPPDLANSLYLQFVEQMQSQLNKEVKTGEFGADMQVQLINDGPVTIILNTDDLA